jgi:2-polyprenyl-3-methyl-5-hydroxy-6-metoxy-1,4-benzoquinol methylase
MKCNQCGKEPSNCDCAITDLLEEDPITSVYKTLYEKIALTDMSHSMQPIDELRKKSLLDYSNIKKQLRKKIPSDTRILEIGPGQGHLAKLLLTDGYILSVMDVVPDYIQTIPCKRFLANVESLPEFDEKFDCIVLCDVLEHVLNEGDAILRVYNNLNCNGILYIRSPLNEPLINYAQILGAPFRFVHLRSYSKKSIKELLASVGAKNLRIKTQGRQKVSFARRKWLSNKNHFRNVRLAAERQYREVEIDLQSNNLIYKIIMKLEYKSMRIIETFLNVNFLKSFHEFVFFKNTEVLAMGQKRCECRSDCG